MIKSATRLVLAVAILLTATASNAVAQIDNRNGNQFDQSIRCRPTATSVKGRAAIWPTRLAQTRKYLKA